MIQTETSDAQKINFIFNTYIFFFSENLELCETMWRNMMDSNNI